MDIIVTCIHFAFYTLQQILKLNKEKKRELIEK